MNMQSIPYRTLCTEFYELDKPTAPEDALQCYLQYAKDAHGPILEPMCGTGRFLIPLLEQGYSVTGFDFSPYMLEICQKKCRERKLSCKLVEASFGNFSLPGNYDLIFIPTCSFCLLHTPEQITQALDFISTRLKRGGKFVFEMTTLKALEEPQGVCKGRWVTRPDGSKIVINTFSKFDAVSAVETILCRYELWEGNTISRTEVEEICLKLYEPKEMDTLLTQHKLKIVGKWQAEPHSKQVAKADDAVILYECIKN